VFLYDIRGVDIEHINDNVGIYVANCWEDVYINSDIVITCTVSESTYIDKRPKRGALLLNASLRDYRPEGISFGMVTTNFIIAQGLGSAFSLDDFAVQRKLWDGSIATELLKPTDFRSSLLALNLGDIQFKLLTTFSPSAVITALFIGILPPDGIMSVVYFAISVILGFAILWGLSSIVQMTAFWVMNVWSLSTLKNLLINVLAGGFLPLWFMPGFVRSFIRFTPFDTIYFAPVKIYLGLMDTNEIFMCYGKQILWFAILMVLSMFMWEKGKKRIIVQGG
jgi:ABC-2 type transport system permease protein